MKSTGSRKYSCQTDLNCIAAALGAAFRVLEMGGSFCFYFSSFRELLQLTCCSLESLPRRRFWYLGEMVGGGEDEGVEAMTAMGKALGLEWDIECGF